MLKLDAIAFESRSLSFLSSYSEVLIVGPVPPPLGGVSVYLYRLNKLLERSKLYHFIGGSILSYLGLSFKLLFTKADVIHISVVNIQIALIFKVLSMVKSWDVVFVDHNDQLFKAKNTIHQMVIKRFLLEADLIVVVGRHILDCYKEVGINIESERFVVENSFIPPPLEDKTRILETYTDEYFSFVDAFQTIIVTSAFKLIKDDDVDLYGIDMVISLIFRLNSISNIDAGLVVFLADSTSEIEYLQELKELLCRLGIEKRILFVTGQKELWPAYLDSDLSVRATSRDGFGVSVAESIYLGCPALASDVCERALGSYLFRSRDQESLNSQAIKILEEKA